MRHPSKTALRTIVTGAATLTFSGGIALLIVGLLSDNPALIGFATTAVPASLASAAAVFGVQTWSDVRIQAVDEKSRDALESFISNATAVVMQGLNLQDVDLPMRANIVTWGSSELLDKLADRTLLIDAIGAEYRDEIARQRAALGDANATVTLELGPRKAQLAMLTTEAIALARRDIGLDPVDAKKVYGVLFGTVDGLTYDEVAGLRQ
ncbi:hypothetical protein SAMN06295924_106129 [Rathayibacter rathayi NCPPB 2980 = VKM Ac-1601]|uniref:hypothetical protein n=1 Tax=Rathayibacter rathayi TaxID=33887 RepID=UPI000BC93793|nr:hypothetical protein [Rathayibacter rathayi]MWV74960.1 hypothetical protein [Rathayibacter rathayi NCPPB 2980 = VKM Ac-1601]TWD70321.1 hypothetical protein FB469_2107 [Rathayibacter rathayi]SOE04982.1 hypothetical protein SAMN06295924_106129 [Rathayibacter rathayi NCPPB 2980 = VKM Ac-1601]